MPEETIHINAKLPVFYHVRFTIDIISTKPIHDQDDLAFIDSLIAEGEADSDQTTSINEEVDGLAATDILRAHGSDPGVFLK